MFNIEEGGIVPFSHFTSNIRCCAGIPLPKQYYSLVLPHLQTHFEASAEDDFLKHCGKRGSKLKIANNSNFFKSNFIALFNDLIHFHFNSMLIW